MKFKSILNPDKYGFEWTNDSMRFWDQMYRSGGIYLHGAAGYFETLGDGSTQHSPLMPVPASMFTDYALSLADWLMKDLLLEGFSSYLLQCEIKRETILFLASIRYKEDKAQWFNLGECKVSSAESKQFDKRWIKIPSWAEASTSSALELYWLATDRIPRDLFQRYAQEELFWEVLYSVVQAGSRWDKLTEYREQIGGDHRGALRALQLVIAARNHLQSAGRAVEAVTSNAERAKQAAAEVAP